MNSNQQKEYTYYYRLRQPGIGCQPKNGLIEIDYNSVNIGNREYWGSVTYNRPLTDEEIYSYDLDYIIEER